MRTGFPAVSGYSRTRSPLLMKSAYRLILSRSCSCCTRSVPHGRSSTITTMYSPAASCATRSIVVASAIPDIGLTLTRCRGAVAQDRDALAGQLGAVGRAAGHRHHQGQGGPGHQRPGAGGERAVGRDETQPADAALREDDEVGSPV